jgi:hypothetical protein
MDSSVFVVLLVVFIVVLCGVPIVDWIGGALQRFGQLQMHPSLHSNLKKLLALEILSFVALFGIGATLLQFHRFIAGIIVFDLATAVLAASILLAVFAIKTQVTKVVSILLICASAIVLCEYLMGIVEQAENEYYSEVDSKQIAELKKFIAEHPKPLVPHVGTAPSNTPPARTPRKTPPSPAPPIGNLRDRALDLSKTIISDLCFAGWQSNECNGLLTGQAPTRDNRKEWSHARSNVFKWRRLQSVIQLRDEYAQVHFADPTLDQLLSNIDAEEKAYQQQLAAHFPVPKPPDILVSIIEEIAQRLRVLAGRLVPLARLHWGEPDPFREYDNDEFIEVGKSTLEKIQKVLDDWETGNRVMPPTSGLEAFRTYQRFKEKRYFEFANIYRQESHRRLGEVGNTQEDMFYTKSLPRLDTDDRDALRADFPGLTRTVLANLKGIINRLSRHGNKADPFLGVRDPFD